MGLLVGGCGGEREGRILVWSELLTASYVTDWLTKLTHATTDRRCQRWQQEEQERLEKARAEEEARRREEDAKYVRWFSWLVVYGF